MDRARGDGHARQPKRVGFGTGLRRGDRNATAWPGARPGPDWMSHLKLSRDPPILFLPVAELRPDFPADQDWKVDVCGGQAGLTIRARGCLCAGLVDDCIQAVEGAEFGDPPVLVIELADISSESSDARVEIVRLHEAVRTFATRTAYVAAQSRYRGMALYALRHTEDDGGRAFPTHGQAREWLASDVARFDDLVAETLGLLERCQKRLEGLAA